MKKIEIAFLIITSFVVIGFTVAINLADTDKESEKFLAKYPMTITNKIPDEYLRLFNDNAIKRLKLINTFNEKAKFPISNIDYDSTYCIQVYKLSSTCGFLVRNGIIDNNADGHRTVKTLYTANQEGLFSINDKVGELDTPLNIYFSLHGDKKQVRIMNDTVADYYSTFKSFSIKYSRNGKQQICADVDQSHTAPIPLEILFLRKNKDLYLLLMCSRQKSTPLVPEKLYSLLKN